MVICLKIKTLDSQTYEFSVDDEVSVREFKETIAEKTNISADLQRLIYCGRVLVDEKKLKEYDVHGKVVHVVERPPPASRLTTQTNDASNRRQREGNDGNVRASPIFRALDGMVLGAMTIPVNASGSGQGAATAVPHLNPSSSFCMNRITVARHMLECANNIAAYLENPERGLNNASLDILTQGRWTMESTVVEVGISAAGNVDIPQNQTQNIAEALHGAVSAALRQNGHPNVTVVQLPTVLGPNGSATVSSHSQPRAIQFNPSELAAAMRDQREPTNNQGESSATNSTSDTASANTNETPSQDTEERERPAENNAQWHRTGTVVLGQVVQQMQSVQRRLDPFIEQYLNILMNDPSFEENDTAGRENAQRVYDRVSEALHYMSHAQHAISDLMLDLSQNSPRYLCCRPILVEQGGFVSSNNYLASFLNPNGNNNESTTANNNSASNNQSSNANPAATQNFAQTSPPTASATENASGPSATSTPSPPNQTSTNARDLHRIISPFLIPVPNRPPPTSTANQNANAENGNQARQPVAEIVLNLAPSRVIIPNPQIPVARLIQAVLDSASFDTDLHVQINGLGFGYPQNASGQQQQPQSQNAATTTQNNTTSTNNASNTESASTNTTESAQPRVTTATLPTTSTQTRSTARPQVHVANIPSSQMWNARVIPANILSSFDRFLPCSSHHIRDNEMGDISQPGVNPFVRPRGTRFRQRRQPQESSTPTNAATSRVPVTPPESSTQSSSSPEPNFESINTPINLFGSIFTLGDLLDIRPSPVTFNRIRNDLHTFIVENLFSGAQINDENMQQAINQVIERLHDALVFLPQFDLPDYDSRASVENLLRASLPFVINLINEDESDEFGIRLLRQCMTFIHRLFVILITCVGRENAELYLNQIAFMVINSNNELEQDTSRALQRHLMAAIRELDLNRLNSSDVQQYLVLRRPAPPTSMCTDSSNFLAESTSTTPSVCAMNIPTAPPRTHADNEPLPTVDVGSEQWHSNFPTSWLPLITRDIERQRRMSPQRPFSDAYISGMSAKRRKLIQSTKTNGGFPTLIADGVRHAIQATGSATSNNSIDDVATSIANDTSVQLSYREAFSTSIQERLRADPDFNPLRFPNTTKFFDK